MPILQLELKHDPFKMLIGCILLNQTTAIQVRRVIFKFFERYPSPQSAIDASVEEMIEILRPLGFYNKRVKTIKKFSEDYINSNWTDPIQLYGIGKYARDSYSIFIEGNFNIQPTDKELIKFLQELN